jgi:adenosylcobinamide-GDP ribazoletransferase
LLGVAIATVIALVMVGLTAIGLLLAGVAAAFGMAKLAQAKIGGQTGDVLGATQQIIALVLLMVMA